MPIHWSIQPFSALTAADFHNILKLRIDVFVVEQNCPYPELDGLDVDALHICGKTHSGALVAYTRLVLSPPTVKITRVVVDAAQRGSGLGHEMMHFVLEEIAQRWPTASVEMSAQTHLVPFYNRHGFATSGAGYLEDGIPHIRMIKA